MMGMKPFQLLEIILIMLFLRLLIQPLVKLGSPSTALTASACSNEAGDDASSTGASGNGYY